MTYHDVCSYRHDDMFISSSMRVGLGLSTCLSLRVSLLTTSSSMSFGIGLSTCLSLIGSLSLQENALSSGSGLSTRLRLLGSRLSTSSSMSYGILCTIEVEGFLTLSCSPSCLSLIGEATRSCNWILVVVH